MKNIIILVLAAGYLFTSCETDPFINPGGGSGSSGSNGGSNNGSSISIDCNKPSSLPAKSHCLSNGSNKAPCYYGDAELTGTWRNLNVTMILNSNGTGTWKTSATAFTPATTLSITWGALLNTDGSKYGASHATPNWLIIINNSSRTDIIDPQFAANGYLPGRSMFTNGWTR